MKNLIYICLFLFPGFIFAQDINYVFNVANIQNDSTTFYRTPIVNWHGVECGNDFVAVNIDIDNHTILIDYDCRTAAENCFTLEDKFVPQWNAYNVKQYNFMNGGYATWDGLLFNVYIMKNGVKLKYQFSQHGYVLNPNLKRS